MSRSDLRVLIVGASIAGPTAAYWFAKSGAKVTVIERYAELRKGGQNIDIRTIGVEVMRRMPGMEKAVRANLYDIEGMSIVDTHGRSFGTLKSTGDADQQSLISEFEIHRGNLSRIIYNMTKDNVRYIFDEQITAIHQKPDGPVTVEFMNNTPTAEYDLVVDCSGATSRTRAIGLGCGVRDHIIPLNSWIAYYAIEKDLLNGSKVGTAYSAPGRFLMVGHHPSGKGNCVGCLSAHKPDPEESVRFRDAQKKGVEATKEYVASRFRNIGWVSNEAIEGMKDSEDFYSTESCQVKVPKLYNGRFVLVGDAGYAPGPTGFGTSLALGGAYILAGEIAKHKGDLDAGLQAYEETMKPLLAEMTKIPPGVPGFMAPQTEFWIWVRNMVFASIAWGMRFGSLFSWVGGMWSSSLGKTKHRLEQYEFGQEKT